MSAKILPFRVPQRSAADPSSKLVSCPFCSFSTEDQLALNWHKKAVHERAMVLYGYSKEKRLTQSVGLMICSVRNRTE